MERQQNKKSTSLVIVSFQRFVFVALLVTFFCLSGWSSASEDPAKPHILMIVADDQAYRDFGFMGNSLVHTPHLDRLAARSARFPHGYVPMSVCRPSLATLLTGLYPHQHGVHFNHPPPGLSAMRRMSARDYRQTRAKAERLIGAKPTLPRILARRGYACLQTGKHWEGDYQTAGFTHGMTLGNPAAARDWVHGTRQQENGQWVAHGNGDAGLAIGRQTMQPIFNFLDEHAKDRPCLVWYAPFLPHSPFDAPQRFRELYRGQKIPEHLLPYYAEIARFDETVGRLLDYLHQNKLNRRTLIVFVSDNGFRPDPIRHDRHNKRSKLSVYEDGIRTPILFCWEGRIQPAEHHAIVQTVDLAPTILTAAGLADEITPRMKGVNLLPLVLGPQNPPSHEYLSQITDRAAYGAIYPNDAQVLDDPRRHAHARWMRHGDYKLIIPGPAPNPLRLSLFNLRKDPREQKNLAGEPRYRDRIQSMSAALDQWWSPADQPLDSP